MSSMALRSGGRGGVRGATRGSGSNADLGILGLLSQVDVHDVIRGVVGVHGLSRDEVALRPAWSRPSSLGRIVAPVIQLGPTRDKHTAPGPTPSCHAVRLTDSPVQAPGPRLLRNPDRPTATPRGRTGRSTGATAAARDDPWRSPHLVVDGGVQPVP